MKHGFKVVRELVKTNPLALSLVKEERLLEQAKGLITRTCGIEVEVLNFESVMVNGMMTSAEQRLNEPYTHVIHTSHDYQEKRFKFDTGIKGLMGIQEACARLKECCYHNEVAGIHYNTDISDIVFNREKWIRVAKAFPAILNSLKSFNYTDGPNYAVAIGMDDRAGHPWYMVQEALKLPRGETYRTRDHMKKFAGKRTNHEWGWVAFRNKSRHGHDYIDIDSYSYSLDCTYQRLELRCGNCTFDYKEVSDRVRQAQRLADFIRDL
jgi:hypothetical protein